MASIIKHTLFLKWWLFISAVMAGATYLYFTDMFALLWNKDATKLSYVLLLLFVFMSVWCGYKTWRLSVFLDSNKTE